MVRGLGINDVAKSIFKTLGADQHRRSAVRVHFHCLRPETRFSNPDVMLRCS
jgi:hypothetical protein